MKRKGFFTLIIPCIVTGKQESYPIVELEYTKVRNGTSGGKDMYTYDIRTKSPNGEFYNRHFHASRFTLLNEAGGTRTNHDANIERKKVGFA